MFDDFENAYLKKIEKEFPKAEIKIKSKIIELVHGKRCIVNRDEIKILKSF